MNDIIAKMYLFALKRTTDEFAPFSHLMIAPSVTDAFNKLSGDLDYLCKNANLVDDELARGELDTILDYMRDCSLFVLGSIDFVSGNLVSCIECHGSLIDNLEVLRNE